jgi:hypothetical protein
MPDSTVMSKGRRFLGLFSAVGFVIVAILLWSVFVFLTNRVVACAATGAWPWPWAGACEIKPQLSGVVIVATLPFAIWASARIFFPPEE